MNENQESASVSVPTLEDEFVLSLGRANTSYRALTRWALNRMAELGPSHRWKRLAETGCIVTRLDTLTSLAVFHEPLAESVERVLKIGTDVEHHITLVAGQLMVITYRETTHQHPGCIPVLRYNLLFNSEWNLFDLPEPERAMLEGISARVLLPGQNMRVAEGTIHQYVPSEGTVILIGGPHLPLPISTRYAALGATPDQPKLRTATIEDIRGALRSASSKWEQNTVGILSPAATATTTPENA